MKKLLLSLLCLGMSLGISGCQNNKSTQNDDLSDLYTKYPSTEDFVEKTLNEYTDKEIPLKYTQSKIKDNLINLYFTHGDCNMIIQTDELGELKYISLTDNGIENNTYSKDFINTLETTLELNEFAFSTDDYNKIITFFNEKEENKKNFMGYVIEQTENSFTIHNDTIDSLKEYANKLDTDLDKNENKSDSLIDQYGKENIQKYCKEIVDSKLKSPSTAKYPGSFLKPDEGWIYSEKKGVITVISYVDAQNSFGATVRNDFTIKMVIENGVGKCTYFKFGNKVIKK